MKLLQNIHFIIWSIPDSTHDLNECGKGRWPSTWPVPSPYRKKDFFYRRGPPLVFLFFFFLFLPTFQFLMTFCLTCTSWDFFSLTHERNRNFYDTCWKCTLLVTMMDSCTKICRYFIFRCNITLYYWIFQTLFRSFLKYSILKYLFGI